MKITKLRHQLYIYQILLTIILFLFLGFTYYSYQNLYNKEIESHIQNEVNLHKKEILSSMKVASEKLEKQRNYFESIHKDTLSILKKKPNYNLEKLKSEIKLKYLSSYIEIELFLIDKTYTIYKTTYPKDLGFNLSVVTEAKDYLDKTSKDGKIYISDFVSTDALDMKYKLYSYSKLKKDIFFEMGFIDTTLTNTMESLLKDDTNSLTKVKLYSVSKDDKQYYYYQMKKNDNGKSKEEEYKEFKKFNLNEKTNNKIINTIKSDSDIHIIDNGIHIVYTKVFNKNMFSVLGFEDIVLKLEIDVSEKLEFLDSFRNIFIYSLIVISAFLLIHFFIIKNKFTNPIEKILSSFSNNKKVDDTIVLSLNNELTEISNGYNVLFDKLNEEIELNKKLLLVDPLTNSYNRKYYMDTLEEVISLYYRYKTPFSLILFDIDDFKRINDNYGHLVGDEILISIVKLVNENLRKTDTLFRIGGEEFIIICKNTVKSEGVTVAEKLRRKIEESLDTVQNETITVSIGVTEVIENDDENSIYQRVDDKLYNSKNNGKNKISVD